MDLALEMGEPYEILAKNMSEREFMAWQYYMAKRMLPTRRMELYFAQLTYYVAATWGGAKDKTPSDFLLFEEQAEALMTEDEMLEEAKIAFQFKPRKKKES